MEENKKTNDSVVVNKIKKTRKTKIVEDDLLKAEIDKNPVKYTSKGTVRLTWIRSEEKAKQIEMDHIVEERAKVLSAENSLKDAIKQKKLEVIESIKLKKLEEKQAQKLQIKNQKIEIRLKLKNEKNEQKKLERESKVVDQVKNDMRGKSDKCRAHQKNLHSNIKKKFIEKNNERERKYPDEEEVITTVVTKRTRSRTPDPTYRNREVQIIPEEKLDTMRDLQRNIFKGIL